MKVNTAVFAIIFCVLALSAGLKEIYSQDEPLSEETFMPKKVEYKPESLRDPFRSYFIEEKKQKDIKNEAAKEQAPVNPPNLQLQGIIWGTLLPQAIINNEVVKPGDSIEGAQIISIDKNVLTVLFNNKFFKLKPPTLIPGGEDEK